MLTKAKIFDEKTKAHGSTESNLAAELTDFLSQIKEEYTSLIKTSEKLQISPSVQEIKIKVAKRKYVKDMPVVEALCDVIYFFKFFVPNLFILGLLCAIRQAK